MFVYRIYRIDGCGNGNIALREDMPVEADTAGALARAEAMATDCIVELWRGRTLLATFHPK
jgi:hypothetical protein